MIDTGGKVLISRPYKNPMTPFLSNLGQGFTPSSLTKDTDPSDSFLVVS